PDGFEPELSMEPPSRPGRRPGPPAGKPASLTGRTSNRGKTTLSVPGRPMGPPRISAPRPISITALHKATAERLTRAEHEHAAFVVGPPRPHGQERIVSRPGRVG